jgi:hypothetical protein
MVVLALCYTYYICAIGVRIAIGPPLLMKKMKKN